MAGVPLPDGYHSVNPYIVADGAERLVDFDGAEQATDTLIARGYTCDYRPGAGLRLGPHLYTTDDEIEAVLAEVASIRGRRP